MTYVPAHSSADLWAVLGAIVVLALGLQFAYWRARARERALGAGQAPGEAVPPAPGEEEEV